ncbi:Hypothetical protein SMAX5B_010842 [Scophthalmus maximus]|uniref:Uncharacterized protein n=1 Tax=Scophthalmus maximus TaxID=52904 RepID=A0A2U9BS00_SCOMX|nr:Hypothetical protein SMAX5B_010842 [Scophthalmus maximus]
MRRRDRAGGIAPAGMGYSMSRDAIGPHKVEAYGFKVVVPTLVVDGLIIGSNLLRYLVNHLRLGRGLLGYGATVPGSDSDPQ